MKRIHASMLLATGGALVASVWADVFQMIRVESINDQRQSRVVGFPRNVNLTRQLSNTPCIRNNTWGVNGSNLWVGNGCRAEFQLQYRSWSDVPTQMTGGWNGGGWNGGNNGNWNGSNNGTWNGGSNGNWNGSNNGSWNGGGWNGGSNGGGWNGNVYRVTLESLNGSRTFRVIARNASVRMVRQISNAPCQQGFGWGVISGQRLWVDNGCRAEFEIRAPF